MLFEGALLYMRNGVRVRRIEWQPNKRVRLMVPDGSSPSDPMVLNPPWLIVERGEGGFEPWVPSQRDILANDWINFDTTHASTR